MDKWEILDHTFKFRVGDSEEAGGCTLIGGEWKDVTTNDLFKDLKDRLTKQLGVKINNARAFEIMVVELYNSLNHESYK